MIFKKIFYVFGFVFLYVLFFTNAKYISDSILNSLSFCSKTLIPSVFPFMVLSLFLIYSSLLESNLRNTYISKNNILGVCKIYNNSIILGSLSGFVTGSRCVCKIYDSYNTDVNSFNHAVAISSNAGIGFTVSCVGILIWGSPLFGVLIYILQIGLAILLGRLFYKKSNCSRYTVQASHPSITKAFTDSVTDSAYSLLSICAFVTVFTILSDILALCLPEDLSYLINIFFEFSSGSFKCIMSEHNYINGFLSGFCIGFGGLSAIFQIISSCADHPFNKGKFFLFKMTHGFMLGLLTSAAVLIFHFEPIKHSSFIYRTGFNGVAIYAPLLILFILKSTRSVSS